MLERLVLSHWEPKHSNQSRLGRLLNKLEALPTVCLVKVAMDATIDDVDDASCHWNAIPHECIIKESPKYQPRRDKSVTSENDATAYEPDESLIGVVYGPNGSVQAYYKL